MGKLLPKPDPTFKAEVDIPIAGKPPVKSTFTFKHRRKTELEEFIRERAGKVDVDVVMEMVVGWDFEDEFTIDSVRELSEVSAGAPLEIFRTYIDELVQARSKT